MTSNLDHTLLQVLVKRLTGTPFKLTEVTPEALLAKPRAQNPDPLRLCHRPKLVFHRVGFELTPDLAIHDTALGSLGLVRLLLDDDAQKARTQLEQWIDDATYARHLILTHDSAQSYAPCPIELVCVVPRSQGVLDGIAQHLRVMARHTAYLHAISVNLLTYDDSKERFTDDGMKQAFAWLLPHTRDRFAMYSKVAAPSERLSTVRLDNYRLSGRRSLVLHQGLRLHVVHGHNGTGKSALAEAIELGVTGRVERIDAAHGRDSAKEYLAIIANTHHPENPVQVTFEFAGTTPGSGPRREQVTLLGDGPQNALGSKLDARSFRLNQAFMDNLTAGSDAGRAEAFLGAFFPQARAAYDKLGKARAAWLEALAALANAPTDAGDSFENELAKAHSGSAAALDYGALLSPVDETTATTLELLNPGLLRTWQELRDILQRPALSLKESGTALEGLLSKLDDDLRRTQDQLKDQQPKLARADYLAGLLANWKVEANASPRHSFATTLGQWLKLLALTDLAERRLHLSDTRELLKQLRPSHSEPSEENTLWAAIPEHDLDPLRRQVDIWRKLRDDCAADVKNLADKAAGSGHAVVGQGSSHPPRLVQQELDTLDQTGRWLFGQDGFGAAIGRAVTQNKVEAFGTSVTIGVGGWTQSWQPTLKALIDAAKQLSELDLVSHGGLNRLQRFRAAALAAHEKQAAANDVVAEFAQHLARLEEPLNELQAMLTPARWAYARTNLRSLEQGDGPSRLQLVTTGGARANLRFNTAELNTLTLALFFLCAPAVGNPLRTLVLDDPFQNMDELTISTVLRGLSRVALLLPPGWQVIILVHGEETLEVVRRELACATYKLPWLAPPTELAESPIEREALDTRESGLQPLGAVLGGEA